MKYNPDETELVYDPAAFAQPEPVDQGDTSPSFQPSIPFYGTSTPATRLFDQPREYPAFDQAPPEPDTPENASWFGQIPQQPFVPPRTARPISNIPLRPESDYGDAGAPQPAPFLPRRELDLPIAGTNQQAMEQYRNELARRGVSEVGPMETPDQMGPFVDISGLKPEAKDWAPVIGNSAAAKLTAGVLAGGTRGVMDMVSFFTTPLGVATAMSGGLAAPLQKAIAAGFSLQMLSQLPESQRAFMDAYHKGDIQGATEAAVGGLGNALFAFLGAKHANAGTPFEMPPVNESIYGSNVPLDRWGRPADERAPAPDQNEPNQVGLARFRQATPAPLTMRTAASQREGEPNAVTQGIEQQGREQQYSPPDEGRQAAAPSRGDIVAESGQVAPAPEAPAVEGQRNADGGVVGQEVAKPLMVTPNGLEPIPAPKDGKNYIALKLDDGRIVFGNAAAHYDLVGQLKPSLMDHVVDGGFLKDGVYEPGGDFHKNVRPGETAVDYWPDYLKQEHLVPESKPQRPDPEAVAQRNLAAAGDHSQVTMVPNSDAYGKGFKAVVSESIYPGKWQVTTFLGDNRLSVGHVFFDSKEAAIKSMSGVRDKDGRAMGDPSFTVSEASTPVEEPPTKPVSPPPIKPPEKPATTSAPVDLDAAYKQASQELMKAREDYHARRIGDAEFLAARSKFDAALKAWEVSRGEAPPEVPPVPTKAKTGQRAERAPDIIDDFVDNVGGKISLQKARKIIADFTPFGALKDIFTKDKSGWAPDVAAQGTGRDVDGQAMLEQMIVAAKVRESERTNKTQERKLADRGEDQIIEFEKLALENKRNAVAKKQAQAIHVGSLNPGDTFTLGGHPFKVKDFEYDEDGNVTHVVVEDGSKFGVQRVGEEKVIYVDPKSFKASPLKEDDWNPEGEQMQGSLAQPTEAERRILKAHQAYELAAKETPGTDQSKLAWQRWQAVLGEWKDGIDPKQAVRDALSFADPTEGQAYAQAMGVAPEFYKAKAGGQASLATTPPAELSGPDLKATGTAELRKLVNDPASNLHPLTVKVMNAMLDTPALRDFDWSDLVTEIKNRMPEDRKDFAGTIEGMLISLSRERMSAETFPHEIFHLLERGLSEKEWNLIEQWRKEEIKAKYGDAAQDLVDGMTSEDFIQAVKDGRYEKSDYHLTDASEWLAGSFGRKFVDDTFAHRNDGAWAKIKAKIARWIQGLADVYRRVVGHDPTADQLFRELLAGRFVNTPESGLKYREKLQGMFVEDAAEARKNAALAKDKYLEGLNQVAQIGDIANVMTSKMTGDENGRVLSKLGYLDKLGIQATGQALAPGITDYRQAKAAMPPERQKVLALATATQIRNLEVDKAALDKEHAAEAQKLGGRAFFSTLAREASARARRDAANLNLKLTDSVLTTALNMTTRALKDEKLSDIERAQLEGQSQELKTMKASSSAMSMLLDDMSRTLASTPEGQKLLRDGGTRADIQRVYRDIKNSTGQTIQAPSLLNWASYAIQRAPELRDRMLANALASQSPIRSLMNAYQSKFLADFENDPVKAIRGMLRDRGRMTSEKEQAAFAWQTLHEEVTEKLRHMADLSEAKDIMDQTLADPRVQALAKEVRADISEIGNTKPTDVFSDSTMVIPGKTGDYALNLGTSTVPGEQASYLAERPKIEKAIDDLASWIGNHSEGDNGYALHVRNHDELVLYLGGREIANPVHLIPAGGSGVLKSFRASLDNVVHEVGGRVAEMLKPAWARYQNVEREAQRFTNDASIQLTAARRRAMESHGLPMGGYGGADWFASLARWHRQVQNELAASWNGESDGLKVGDNIGTLGWKVTPEDMAELKLSDQLVSRGFEIAGPEQFTKDTTGKVATYRKAQKTTPLQTFRMPDWGQIDFARKFGEAFTGWDAKDPASVAATLAKLAPLVKQKGADFLRAMNNDRSPQHANVTPFDGTGGAFERVKAQMEAAPGRISTLDQYLNALSNVSGLTPDEVATELLPEWNRMIGHWYRQFKPDDTESLFTAVEKKNSFTQGRKESIAPYFFYQNGFDMSEGAVRNFGHGITSRARDKVGAGIRFGIDKLTEDLQAMRDEAEKGTPIAKVVSQRQAELAAGRNFDRLENIEKRISFLKDVHGVFADPSGDKDIDQTVARLVGDAQSTLLGEMNALRNILFGPMYAYKMAADMAGYGSLAQYPLAAWNGWVRAQVPYVSSGVAGLAKAVTWGTLRGVGSAVANASVDRSVRKFAQRIAHPIIEDLNATAYRLYKMQRTLIDSGLQHVPDYTTEADNMLLGSISAGGQMGLQPDMGHVAKLVNTGLGSMEATFGQFRKALWGLGDTALNKSIELTLRSSFGPVEALRRAVDHAYAKQQKNPYRAFDFANPRSLQNVFSSQELFPLADRSARAYRVLGDKERLNEVLGRAGLDADTIAARRWIALKNGQANAPLLNPTEMRNLINSAIDHYNRGSATDRSLKLARRTYPNLFLGTFQSWSGRMASTYLRTMSTVPSSHATPARRLLAFAATTAGVTLPILLTGAATAYGAGWLTRQYYKAMYGKEMAARLPTERQGAASQAIGWGLAAVEGIPYLSMLTQTMFNDMPNRASFDPSFVLVKKAQDLARYVGGVIQTGNIGYRLPETIAGFAPDSQIILNRLPSMEGKVDVASAVNLYRRDGPQDMLKPYSQANAIVTPLTPYADQMVNAAAKGDLAAFKDLRDQAVQVATDMGAKDPEKKVLQMFESRNPELRAFTTKLTDEQRADFLDRLTPDQRDFLTQLEGRMTEAAQSIGGNMTFTRAPLQEGGAAASALGPGTASVGVRSGTAGLSASASTGLSRAANQYQVPNLPATPGYQIPGTVGLGRATRSARGVSVGGVGTLRPLRLKTPSLGRSRSTGLRRVRH